MSARKNLKIEAEAYERAAEAKGDGETWSEFMIRAADQTESRTGREVSPEQTREAVREVLREEGTRDVLSVVIESVLEDRIAEDIRSAISRDPPEEVIRRAVADVLQREGILSSAPLPIDRDSHDDLVEVVRAAPSREWIDEYLDVAAKFIDVTEVTEDDDQLVMSVRTDQKSLPISLGNRYCLKAYAAQREWGLIYPPEGAAVDELRERATYTSEFSGEDAPHWYKLSAPSADRLALGEFEEDWVRAVKTERERGNLRVRGDAHNPAVYRAATDPVYRRRLLTDAGFES